MLFVPAKTTNLFLASPKQENFNLKIKPFTHEAFFCKMEDKLHARFNIWIKLRAGSDEIYRKMTGEPLEIIN